MSTDTTRGADASDPTISSSSAAGNADGDAAEQQERVADPALTPDAEQVSAREQHETRGGAAAEVADSDLLGPLDKAEQPAEALAQDFGAVAEQPAALEPAEPEDHVDDQLTDPAFSPPVYPEAASVDSWAQTSVSPDYVPPSTPDSLPYTPSYAFPRAAAPEEEPFPRTPGYPPRYAPPVYPLPPAARRMRLARLPLVGVLLAVALAAVVVFALARGVFSASGRSATGPLYSSAMTSSSSDWPDDKECYFKSDGYHIVGASNCYYSGAQYQDATVTVTAKLLKGDAQGAYGIAFRRPSKDNFYIFLVNGSGDWFTVKDNSLLQKAQFNSAIKTGVGASNTLSVRMQGNQFTFFANGTELGSLTDDTYTTGAVGLAGDTNLDVTYRNFTVARP